MVVESRLYILVNKHLSKNCPIYREMEPGVEDRGLMRSSGVVVVVVMGRGKCFLDESGGGERGKEEKDEKRGLLITQVHRPAVVKKTENLNLRHSPGSGTGEEGRGRNQTPLQMV